MKGKLFLVGLLSFSVLGLGGFYFFGLKNNQFNPRGTYSEFFIGEANSNQQFVPMKDYSTSTKPRRRGQRGRSNNNSWGVASPNFNRSSVNVHRYSSMNESKSVSANYFQHSGEEYVKNTGGLGGSNLLIAGRSSSSTSGDGGGASFGGIAFGTGYGRPQSAPPIRFLLEMVFGFCQY